MSAAHRAQMSVVDVSILHYVQPLSRNIVSESE